MPAGVRVGTAERRDRLTALDVRGGVTAKRVPRGGLVVPGVRIIG